jgi:hypothetical protein
MSEIEKALAELKALMKYREEQLGHKEGFRRIGLTSRKNLCLHPSDGWISQGEEGEGRRCAYVHIS